MSKIIDEFNKLSQSKDKTHTAMQEEIAKMYLRTSDKKNKRKKNILMPKIPRVAVLAALFLVFLVAIIFFKANIDIKMIGKITRVKKEGIQDQLFFIKGSEPNKNIIKNASFLGDAQTFSRTADDELVLNNSKGYGWANYTIELREPIDLTKVDIKYTAKGIIGDEYLLLSMGDASNRTYRMEKQSASALTKDWQTYTINFSSIGNALDLKNISTIRFEFGSLTAGNRSAATIFLKDIYVIKAKRTKWL